MSKIQWKDWLHGEHDEFPSDLAKELSGTDYIDYDTWHTLPKEVLSGIHYALYEVDVLLETDMDTGDTEVLSFTYGGKVYKP